MQGLFCAAAQVLSSFQVLQGFFKFRQISPPSMVRMALTKVTLFSSHQNNFFFLANISEAGVSSFSTAETVEHASFKSHTEMNFCYIHTGVCQQGTKNQPQQIWGLSM